MLSIEEMKMNPDLLAFVEAIASAFPEGAERDRFGRYADGLNREREALRQLAVKYRVGGGYDTQDQAGKVARAILAESGKNVE